MCVLSLIKVPVDLMMATGLAIGGSGGGGSMELLKYGGFGLLDRL